MVVCPFCSAGNGVVLESFPIADLDALYRRLYKAPVARLFGGRDVLSLMRCVECDLRWYEPMAGGDEDFYNTLQHKPWYYVDHKHEFDLALPCIEPGSAVLEVGSGKGNFARFLQNSGRPHRYTGLDFSSQAQRMAASNGIDIRIQSIQEFADSHSDVYDVVCAFQVLEHVVEIRSFLNAVAQALKPGGLMLIAVPSEDSYISQSNNLALNLPPHHISRYTDRWFTHAATILDMELLRVEHDPLQPHHRFDYIYQLTIASIYKLMRRRRPMVDHRWMNWLARIPAFMLGKFLAQGLGPHNSPHGHTVLAVFRKPLAPTRGPIETIANNDSTNGEVSLPNGDATTTKGDSMNIEGNAQASHA
ncbi:MAG: class I SAM-dependent methyltransferase [Sphingomonadales bacterium]|nr:class I SAM-dependent methyltransferase [Sphingomonadales bacterium]